MINTHIHLIKKLDTFQPRNVVEIGSRDAKDAIHYASEFGIAHRDVIVFEPNPWLASSIKDQFPEIVVRDEAIGVEEGDTLFHCILPNADSCTDSQMYEGMSSLLQRVDNLPAKRMKMMDVPVKVRKMQSIVREMKLLSIDICKIDAEGTTLSVLQSFGSDIDKVKSFHLEMEYRPYWKGQDLAPATKQFLMKHNFSLLSESYIGNTDQSDSVWINNMFLNYI